MALPRVLVSGPIAELDEWCAAARGAGWEPIAWPLIVIEERQPDEALARGVSATAPEHLCVTSAHAIPFLEALAARAPVLRTRPCSIVGQRSVAELRSLGFRGEIEWHESAEALREELCSREPRPARVLWPRGDRSDELALGLRAAGIAVLDPIAYVNRPRAAGERTPDCELVFFASPSGVRAWAGLSASHAARRALCIGSTTCQALLAEKNLPFFDIISLPEPTSGSFALALQHIDLRPMP
jgi:uroporphyrinogen-III synthase